MLLSLNNTNFLNESQIKSKAPSVYTKQGFEDLSNKYTNNNLSIFILR